MKGTEAKGASSAGCREVMGSGGVIVVNLVWEEDFPDLVVDDPSSDGDGCDNDIVVTCIFGCDVCVCVCVKVKYASCGEECSFARMI